ncbi:peptide chain release factor 2, partial [Candidatus Roizmanbacteria bacterium CG_4_10_14_0_8_um_filter_33_9]
MIESHEELERKLINILQKANLNNKKNEINTLEKNTYESSFWNDPKKASETLKKISSLKKEVDDIEMMQLLFEEGEIEESEKLIKKYEILLFLSGPYDKGGAVFSIHAGQGGTEA